MCGIVGVMGDLSKNHIDMFNGMLIVDYLRGKDSTGVMSYNRHTKGFDVIKDAVDPITLQQYKKYDSVVSSVKSVIIGHNRAATQGSVCRANAHPFVMNAIGGVHNGTIPWDAKRELTDYASFDTDSEAIYHNIEMHGVPETIGAIWGAWSLAFVDRAEGTFHLLRNKERPMFFAKTEDKKVMFFASEPWMILGLASRYNIDLDKLYITNEDCLYTWEIPKSLNKEIGEYTTVKVPGGAPKNVGFHSRPGSTYYGEHHFDRSHWEKESARRQAEAAAAANAKRVEPEAKETVEKESTTTDERRVVVNMTERAKNFRRDLHAKLNSDLLAPYRIKKDKSGEHYRDVGGHAIYRDTWDKLGDHTCAYCSADVGWGEPIGFTRDHSAFLCEDCLKDEGKCEVGGLPAVINSDC